MCTESDFKDIGLPLGPRKKLLSFLKQKQEKEKNYQEQEQIQQSVFAALKEDNTQSIPSKAEVKHSVKLVILRSLAMVNSNQNTVILILRVA